MNRKLSFNLHFGGSHDVSHKNKIMEQHEGSYDWVIIRQRFPSSLKPEVSADMSHQGFRLFLRSSTAIWNMEQVEGSPLRLCGEEGGGD
jgi:hypothetical protein